MSQINGKKPIKKDDYEIRKFKEKYFEFYDDIKDHTRGVEDW